MQKASKRLLIIFLLLSVVIGSELVYLFFSNKQAKSISPSNSIKKPKPKGINKDVFKGLQNYEQVPSIELFMESEIKTTILSVNQKGGTLDGVFYPLHFVIEKKRGSGKEDPYYFYEKYVKSMRVIITEKGVSRIGELSDLKVGDTILFREKDNPFYDPEDNDNFIVRFEIEILR